MVLDLEKIPLFSIPLGFGKKEAYTVRITIEYELYCTLGIDNRLLAMIVSYCH